MHTQDIINALGTHATPTPLSAKSGSEQGIAGAAGLRLMGFSVSANAQSGILILHHGTSSGDPVLFFIDLTSNPISNSWFGPGGLAVPNGVYVERTLGTTAITLFSKSL